MMRHYQAIFWTSLLGFTSGFALLFPSHILTTWLLDSGVDLIHVGWVSCLTLPYLCSFLWMPLIEYINHRFLSYQQLMSINFLLLASLMYLCSSVNPIVNMYYVMGIGFMMAIVGATQDHVIEAYRLRLLPKDDYVFGVSASLMAFRVGVMLAGGGGLIFAATYGWSNGYLFAATLMGFVAVAILFSPKVVQEDRSERLSEQIKQAWGFLTQVVKNHSFTGCLLTHRVSVFWLEAMMPAYLMRYVGMSILDIGIVYKLYGMMGLLLGGVIVNRYVSQDRLLVVLYQCLICQMILCLLFYLSSLGINQQFISALVFSECALQGVLGTISTIWLMGKANQKMPAFSFSVWYGVAGLGRVVVGPLAVWVIDRLSWGSYMLFGVILAIISIIMCHRYLRQEPVLA